MENTTKTIRSINLVAWLISHGCEPTSKEYDYKEKCFYWIFPEDNATVGKWINRYRRDSELTEFLATYSKLKKEIKVEELKLLA